MEDKSEAGLGQTHGKIPARSIRLAQTTRAQQTSCAVFGAGMIDIIHAVTVDLAARMTLQLFSVWTTIDAFAELDIGDIRVEVFIIADCQAVERMIVAIGGEFFALEVVRGFADRNQILFGTVQHRLEVFVILTGESLGGENHLRLGIDQGLGVISLDDPFEVVILADSLSTALLWISLPSLPSLGSRSLRKVFSRCTYNWKRRSRFCCRSISTCGCLSACTCWAMTRCSFSCNLSRLCLSSSIVPLDSLETLAESLTLSREKWVTVTSTGTRHLIHSVYLLNVS
jgi:hypothetical protein